MSNHLNRSIVYFADEEENAVKVLISPVGELTRGNYRKAEADEDELDVLELGSY